MAALVGMIEIAQYVRRSEATVLKLHREYEFPAVKIGGTWESDTAKIDQWRLSMIDTHREKGVD